MAIEILRRTPPWVFVLFIGLLAYGYYQSKPRRLTLGKVMILPAVMVCLSFLGVLSAFGASPTGLLAWAAGLMAATTLGLTWRRRERATHAPATDPPLMPGSWVPLALMMAIFFTKYAVGVAQARQLPVMALPTFVLAVGFLYGVYSGLFLSRAARHWRIIKSNKPVYA